MSRGGARDGKGSGTKPRRVAVEVAIEPTLAPDPPPNPDHYYPMAEGKWSLSMTAAWIARRSVDAVRWQLPEWRVADGMRPTESLITTSIAYQDDEGENDPAFFPTTKVMAELQRAGATGEIQASAIPDDTGKTYVLTRDDWHYGRWEHALDDSYWAVHGRKLAQLSFEREEVLALWQAHPHQLAGGWHDSPEFKFDRSKPYFSLSDAAVFFVRQGRDGPLDEEFVAAAIDPMFEALADGRLTADGINRAGKRQSVPPGDWAAATVGPASQKWASQVVLERIGDLKHNDSLTMRGDREPLWIGIRVETPSLLRLFGEGDLKGAVHRQSRRGPRPRYDWTTFYDHMDKLFQHHGCLGPDDPDWCRQTQVEAAMADWCVRAWGQAPSESTVRAKVSAAINGHCFSRPD